MCLVEGGMYIHPISGGNFAATVGRGMLLFKTCLICILADDVVGTIAERSGSKRMPEHRSIWPRLSCRQAEIALGVCVGLIFCS